MSPPQQTTSVSRAILFIVGVAFIIMETIAVGYRATSEWQDIETRGAQRAATALDILEIVHEQAMLNSNASGVTDPAIATLDGVMERFTSATEDMRLWMSMAPKLVAHPRTNAAQQTKSPDPELPRDRIDHEAIAGKKTATGVVDGWLRVTRPSIMGEGGANHARCAGCHTDLKAGDVIGAYSVGVDLAKAKARWSSQIKFEAATAFGIVMAVLGVIAVLLNLTTLAPLRRLTMATRRLAAGNLSVEIEGADRADELGTLSRSLEVFRGNLLEKREAEDQIAHMARHDALTGLPNRTSLHRFLQQAVTESPSDVKIAVASMDLDEFKEVNDLHGQSAGDAVLKAVAASLVKAAVEGEFVSRVGGDEFVAFRRFRHQSELFGFVSRLRTALSVEVAADSKAATARIGVAVWPDDAQSPDALLAKADNALQRAKSDNLCSVCYYEATLDEAARRRRQIISALAGAAERGELFLNFQVQKSIKELKTTGYEALLRWQHPELGLVSPAEFIPIAEQCGAIVGIGEWVLRAACHEAAKWPVPHKVAVNISPIQLAGRELHELVHDVLMQTGLDPSRLELEITETAIIGDRHEALDTLRKIKALGVSVALDDFGRGYSSLETLRLFPFDKIKLDRFFVTELVGNAEARAIIRAIVALGKSLSIPVLAEGIETEEQLAVLRREHCSEGQGYLFGRPQPFIETCETMQHVS